MMNKKALISIVVALALVVGGAMVWAAVNNVEEGDRQSEQSTTEINDREQAVLEEAERFHPPAGMNCTTVMTPARHIETGVTHTFTSGCLPEGWERIDSQPGVREDDSSVDQDDNSDDGQPTSRSPSGNSSSRISPSSAGSVEVDRATAQKRAIDEAENFRPKGNCTTVLTPARHLASGATYTFPSGCIPDGWERTDSPGIGASR